MTPVRLSVCVVTFEPCWPHLARTLARLGDAIAFARARGSLAGCAVTLVDNGPGHDRERLALLAEAALARAPGTASQVLTGHGNVGFGRGHNLGMRAADAAVHLILNPDVEMDEDALDAGVRYLEAHPEAGAVMAAARDDDGERLYLAKSMPSVLALLLRGFAPAWLRSRFQGVLDRYEMRERDWTIEQFPILVAGGCFLLCRRSALDAVGAFDEGYFLYFEDYDLSMRLARTAPVGYSPAVRVIHHGGGAARKGWQHTLWFITSARRFFATHGWRWS
jgi:GT2 family glycosyltransferase